MSQLLLQEYLMKFAELQGLSQWDCMTALRGEHTRLPCLKEPFATYLHGLGDEGALEALAHLEKMP
jgi:hypothetical protein